MKRHISIFTFLLGAFAAGLAFEAGAATAQTIYGGYCYTGSQYRSDLRDQHMKVNDSFMPVTLSKPGDKAVCTATKPDGMRIADNGWGYVKSEDSSATRDIMEFDNVTWDAKSSSEYEWKYDGFSSGSVAIAVRFDYIKYTLKFASSQGGTMPADIATTYEKQVTVPAPLSAPTGYHFVKWIATSSFDKEYRGEFETGNEASGEDFGLAKCHEDDSVITLMAQWTANTYAVSSAGENCTASVATSAAYDGDLTINWTPDGNWKKPTVKVYAGTDDKGTLIKTYSSLPEETVSTTFKMRGLGAYYANVFIKVSYDVHTLTFDPNGGTCGEKSRRVESGALIGELPVATQYQKTQKGWWDDPGAGNPITAATVYNFPGDVTAYAHWEKAELFNIDTIADPEEGGTLTGGGSYEKDERITLTATPSNGYSFVKWTAQTSGEEWFNASWPITVAAGDLYTAFFTGNVYTVKFDCDEDLAERAQVTCPKSIKLTYGDPFGDLPAPTVGNPDYRFVCWMFEDETEITPDTIFLMSGKNNYVYAKVVLRPTYEIHYNGNGSTSGSMANQKMYCGVADNLTSNAYERIGYHFRGWATNTADAAARKIVYADGERVTDIASTNETATLYAVWDAITLGEAMHCNDTNLVWESKSYYPMSVNEWTPVVGASIGYDGDSCVQQIGASGNLGKQQWLQTQVSTNGHFSFKWKPSGENGEISIAIMNNANPPGRDDYKPVSYISSEWQTYEVDISKGYYMKIANSGASNCSIDQMTWTPGGPEPVDGVDNVDISSAGISADGKFVLSFQSDEKFDYNLLTNADLLGGSWGVMGEKKIGDGSILTFEPQIIEGQPQMFYKVETIQKK